MIAVGAPSPVLQMSPGDGKVLSHPAEPRIPPWERGLNDLFVFTFIWAPLSHSATVPPSSSPTDKTADWDILSAPAARALNEFTARCYRTCKTSLPSKRHEHPGKPHLRNRYTFSKPLLFFLCELLFSLIFWFLK